MAITLGIMAFVFAGASLDAQGQPHLQGISGPIALLGVTREFGLYSTLRV
jgi:hypothetical protein